jgi:hypothetical protein
MHTGAPFLAVRLADGACAGTERGRKLRSVVLMVPPIIMHIAAASRALRSRQGSPCAGRALGRRLGAVSGIVALATGLVTITTTTITFVWQEGLLPGSAPVQALPDPSPPFWLQPGPSAYNVPGHYWAVRFLHNNASSAAAAQQFAETDTPQADSGDGGGGGPKVPKAKSCFDFARAVREPYTERYVRRAVPPGDFESGAPRALWRWPQAGIHKDLFDWAAEHQGGWPGCMHCMDVVGARPAQPSPCAAGAPWPHLHVRPGFGPGRRRASPCAGCCSSSSSSSSRGTAHPAGLSLHPLRARQPMSARSGRRRVRMHVRGWQSPR